jgi:hypothetical protein
MLDSAQVKAGALMLTVSLRFDYFAAKRIFIKCRNFPELHIAFSRGDLTRAWRFFPSSSDPAGFACARRLVVARYLDNKDLKSLYLNSERVYEARQGKS